MPPGPVSRPGARLVRVFVSSTFQDMHAERDYLNRIVWPELRNRCLRRGAEFVGVDLRWGVTREDAEARGALALCLEEIDRCNYVVGLIGERYGWVPPPDNIPAAVFDGIELTGPPVPPSVARLLRECYARDDSAAPPVYRLRPTRPLQDAEKDDLVRFWESCGLSGQSITELEVRHALDRLQLHQLLFYVRETPASGGETAFASIFHETDPRRHQRLVDLRAAVTRAGAATRTYAATFEGVRVSAALLPSTLTPAERRLLADGVIQPTELVRAGPDLRRTLADYGTAALGGLDAWGERLQEDLWAAIEQDLEPARDVAPLMRDRANHEQFLLERTSLFVGRDDLVAIVVSYAQSGDHQQPLVLTGDPGSGKSATMAECARRCRELVPAAIVVPHFVGAAPGSTVPAATVQSLCETLRQQGGLSDEIPANREDLFAAFAVFLKKAAKKGPVILFIDALDQLDAQGGGHDLSWLPPALPRGATMIVSTLRGAVLDRLRQQVPPGNLVQVNPLRHDERGRLVHELLARRGKRLAAGQLERLLDTRVRPDAGLPLYVTVAVEELSLFGQYDALDTRIDGLPSTLTSLFDQVLARVEQDHGRSDAELVLRMLAASRAGLLESEVLDLLESHEPGFPRLRWIRLYRSLEFYLRRMDEASGAGLLDFYHEQIRRAVYRRYFGMSSRTGRDTPRLTRAHQRLAAYFDGAARGGKGPAAWDAVRARPLGELPYHLAHGRQWHELRDVLTDHAFLQAKVTALGPQPLVDDFDLAFEAPSPYTEAAGGGLRSVQAALRLSAHAVASDPVQLPAQLLGRLLGSDAPDVQRVVMTAREWREAAWLRPLSPFVASPGGSLVRVLIAQRAGKHVAMTPDGRRVVASARKELGVWDVATGRLERTIVQQYEEAFAATPDGKSVVIAGGKGMLQIRDVESGRLTRSLDGQVGKLTAAVFSLDGQLLVTGNILPGANRNADPVVLVWDLAGGTLRHRLAGHAVHIRNLAISPDGTRAVSVGGDRTVRVWSLLTGELLHCLPHESIVVTAAAVTPDGRRVVTASAEEGRVIIWDMETGSEVQSFSCPQHRTTRVAPYANAVAMARNGALAVFAMMDDTLRVWNPVTCTFEQVLTGHADEVLDVAVSADGSLAVSTSSDGTVRLWRPRDAADDAAATGHVGRITSLALTPDGTRTLSASWDHTIAVWDTRTGGELSRLTGHGESVNAVLATPDGKRAVSSSSDATVKVWNLRNGKPERSFQGGTGGEWPTDRLVVLTSDGTCIVSAARSGMLAMYRVASKVPLWQREADSLPRYVAVTPDGAHVLYCSGDGDLWILDAGTGSRTHLLKVASRDAYIVAATPDSRHALVGYNTGSVRVWDVRSGTRVHTFGRHKESISALAVTPDGRYAVSGDRDGIIKVWDLASGREHATLEGHSGRIWILAVAPNSRYCVTGSGDHSVRVWDVEAGQPVAALLTEGHVWACAVGPDSRTIVAGGDSGRVHFLELVDAAG